MAEYGSLINMISGSNPELKPEVGMGATILMWTDRRAATVIEVSKSGKKVTVQFDKATSQGSFGSQDWKLEPDPNGSTREYTKRKNGQWVAAGDSMRGGQRLGLGYRDHYFDYSF
jgi:hypothetical protein